MIAASWIESFPTTGAATLALHILPDGQLCATGATKYGWLVPLPRRPDLDLMIGECGVAILAGIVDVTALHPDRNDVGSAVIMTATSLRVDIDATNLGASRCHRECGKRNLQPIVSSSS